MVTIFQLLPTYYFYPVTTYEDGTVNESDGEVVKMNFKEARDFPIGKQVVGSSDGYDFIWRHLGFGYYKITSKVKESPWTCQ